MSRGSRYGLQSVTQVQVEANLTGVGSSPLQTGMTSPKRATPKQNRGSYVKGRFKKRSRNMPGLHTRRGATHNCRSGDGGLCRPSRVSSASLPSVVRPLSAASAVLLLPAVRPVLPCLLHGVSLEVDVRELTQSAIFSSKRETLPGVAISDWIKSTQNGNKSIKI